MNEDEGVDAALALGEALDNPLEACKRTPDETAGCYDAVARHARLNRLKAMRLDHMVFLRSALNTVYMRKGLDPPKGVDKEHVELGIFREWEAALDLQRPVDDDSEAACELFDQAEVEDLEAVEEAARARLPPPVPRQNARIWTADIMADEDRMKRIQADTSTLTHPGVFAEGMRLLGHDPAPNGHYDVGTVMRPWYKLFFERGPAVRDAARLVFDALYAPPVEVTRQNATDTMPAPLPHTLVAALPGPPRASWERPSRGLSEDGTPLAYHLDDVSPDLVPKAKLIQGGVLRTRGCKARDKLHEKLVACGYNCRDGAYSVSLFCDRNLKWHPEVFCGTPATADPMHDLYTTNVYPVRLTDPTPEAPWHETELLCFFRVVDAVAKDLIDGKTVVVACMLGANRSKGVLYALDPREENEPSCPAMLQAAKAYLDNRNASVATVEGGLCHKPTASTRGKRGRA